MVASPTLALGLVTVGRAGLAEDDDVLVAVVDDVCTEVMVCQSLWREVLLNFSPKSITLETPL